MITGKRIFLITSGAYVNSELASDFGLIPTAFLPVGHKRLMELQFDLIKSFDVHKYISLPDDFNLPQRDINIIKENSINIYRSPKSFSLKQSLISFISNLNLEEVDELYVLHGDTLYSNIDLYSDILYVNNTNMFYKWGNLEDITDKYEAKFKNSIISGYFSFKDVNLLKKSLENSSDFVEALNYYNKTNKFKLIKGENWLDFGHSNLYYKSKVKLNVTRNFNKTEARLNYILKSSLDYKKIINEFKWFEEFPNEISHYTPRVWGLDSKESAYKIEFVAAPTIQEKWVFGELDDKYYYNSISELFALISNLKSYSNECDLETKKQLLTNLYINKTELRLKEYILSCDYNFSKEIYINKKKYPSLEDFKKEVFENLNSRIKTITKPNLGLMHGDLCFSNVLIDNRCNSIKLIDPRGSLSNDKLIENCTLGDFAYDVAKIGHSLLANYDFIVTGFYDLHFDLNKYEFDLTFYKKTSDDLTDLFYSKSSELGLSKIFVKSSIANLFLSMLPLHKENKNRQLAFLINAYKFYYD